MLRAIVVKDSSVDDPGLSDEILEAAAARLRPT
jgi:hypothetical protein